MNAAQGAIRGLRKKNWGLVYGAVKNGSVSDEMGPFWAEFEKFWRQDRNRKGYNTQFWLLRKAYILHLLQPDDPALRELLRARLEVVRQLRLDLLEFEEAGSAHDRQVTRQL